MLDFERSVRTSELDGMTIDDVRRLLFDRLKQAGGHEQVYADVRDWLWRVLMARRFDADLRGWHDVVRSISATLSRAGDAEAAAKMAVLGQMILKTVRFLEVHAR